jgi:hypothetical protein
MSQAPLQKPTIVKATIILFGLFAFISWVSLGQGVDSPAQQIASILRITFTNAAFIGVLSNTRIGRRIALVFFSVLCIAGVTGAFAAIHALQERAASSTAILVLVIAIFAWSYAYAFGKAARDYYVRLWESK